MGSHHFTGNRKMNWPMFPQLRKRVNSALLTSLGDDRCSAGLGKLIWLLCITVWSQGCSAGDRPATVDGYALPSSYFHSGVLARSAKKSVAKAMPQNIARRLW
jgi:hypothetical protein